MAVAKKIKKDRNFHASNWLFAQTTRVDIAHPPERVGRVWEVVIYFKFHENRPRSLRAVEGRKSPSPIDKVHGLMLKQQFVLPYKP